MGTSRRKFTSGFKKQVVLEALRERRTIQTLAVNHDIYPRQIIAVLGAFKGCHYDC